MNPGAPAPRAPLPPAESEIRDGWTSEVPVVSILCAAYQHGPFIHETLNGFLSQQTDFPFEIVIHDDCSLDDTAAKIDAYVERYPTLITKIQQETNQFRRGKRPIHFTWPVARGRYLALCEGDDYWLDPHKLQKQIDHLEQHPDVVLVGHDKMIIEDGKVVDARSTAGGNRVRHQGSDVLKLRGYFHTSSWCFRNVLTEIPEEMGRVGNVDIFLLSILGTRGDAVFMENVGPSVYRQHAGGNFSSLDATGRAAALLTTHYWIAAYWRRVGRNDVASHVYAKMARSLIIQSPQLDMDGLRGLLRSSLRTWSRRWLPGAAADRRVRPDSRSKG